MSNADGPTFEFIPQPNCRLLQLPRELRDKVYNFLFLSTRITFGKRIAGRYDYKFNFMSTRTVGERTAGRNKYIKPAAHSLALLRVCRQIFDETKSLWLERVLFNFESIEGIFDKLLYLPSATLSRIRYLRTREDSWILSFDNGSFHHNLAELLELLPGLRLDTLTVLGSLDGIVNYGTLKAFIDIRSGWKELHYITPNSTMLGFENERLATTYSRRNEFDSEATVAIYQAVKDKAVGAPFTNNNSQPLTQTMETSGVQEDVQLMSDGQRKLELLVIVKRSHTRHFAEINDPEHDKGPYHSAHIRKQTDGMAWPAIKANWKSNYGDFPQEEETLEADTYDKVNEYIWDWGY